MAQPAIPVPDWDVLLESLVAVDFLILEQVYVVEGEPMPLTLLQERLRYINLAGQDDLQACRPPVRARSGDRGAILRMLREPGPCPGSQRRFARAALESEAGAVPGRSFGPGTIGGRRRGDLDGTPLREPNDQGQDRPDAP